MTLGITTCVYILVYNEYSAVSFHLVMFLSVQKAIAKKLV